MNTTSSINIREVAFPAILSMVLFSAAIFLPPLGILFSIFCPVPIILAYLYRGQRTGLICSIIVAIILFLFINVQISLVFFAEYGLIAVIMAESIRRNYSIDKIVLYSVGASFLLGGVLIYLFLLAKDINLSSFMTEQITQSMNSSMDAYRQMGISNSEIDNIKLYSEKLASVFIGSIPAWMIVSSTIGVLLNYVLVKMVWNKYVGNSIYFESADLEKWSANEYLIWLFIFSGIMLLIPAKDLNTIGLNSLIISLMVYFFQGIAVIIFYMKKKTFPLFLKIIIYGLIIIQPLLLLFVILIGVFDTWADFRKLKFSENNTI
ncbi:MAG TPA: DUF2232 domain-containing protein [Nitrospinota bacterium]|nr:DUF2232 domain-containing protein [Nitrospinota bacterium]